MYFSLFELFSPLVKALRRFLPFLGRVHLVRTTRNLSWILGGCFFIFSAEINATGGKASPVQRIPPAKQTSLSIKKEQLIPHRAEYTVELESKNRESDVSDLKGVLTIQLIDTGEGWAFEQHSVLQVYDLEGHLDQYITTIVSWESKNGKAYKFRVRSLRNGQEEEFIEGHGESFPDKEAYIAYEQPSLFSVKILPGTFFPLTHLRKTLQAADAGERVFSNKIVFDGSSDTFEPVDINVAINPVTNSKLIINNPQLLSDDQLKLWSLHMAIFPRESKNPEPDYEIIQNVLSCGIITSMIMEYKEENLKTKLTLKSVDVFPNK